MVDNEYDILIIGAGPAGLMAASQCKGKVVVLEKMDMPCVKLRLTGKGRCNITNSAKLSDFVKHFGKNGRFLKHALVQFFNEDLIKYFEKLGVEFKLERGGRYFPKSDKSFDIFQALIDNTKEKGVIIYNNCEVSDISKDENKFLVTTKKGQNFITKKVIITCGGKSYPKTGSSGDGYKLAKKMGHTIIEPIPSLVPLITEGFDAKKLQGLSLKNVKASLYSNNKKITEQFGEMLFADFGLTGPVILSLSKHTVPLLSDGKNLEVSIDLKPALDFERLDERLKREIDNGGKKYFKNLLKNLLPAKLVPFFIEKLNIPVSKKLNQINSEERKKLKMLLKDLRFPVIGCKSFDQAIVTAGGINLKEVNPKTMESRIVPGLYFAGEVLDIDADTGGFNLQAAFSTGYLAGKSTSK